MNLERATMFRFTMAFIGSTLFALPACSDDNENDGKTAATCPAICARQNELCGSSTNCGALCPVLADMASTTGCTAENQAGLDCLAEKDVCDSNSTVCPAAEFDACVDAYCTSNPSASVCQ